MMETAWSTMWNVTDETPVNCERFLAGGGMYLFLKVIKSPSSSSFIMCVLPILPLTCEQLAPQCKERFPEKADLLRNMMGLLGNVAEVLIIGIIVIIIIITITIILVIINVIINSSKTIIFYRCQNCGTS